MHDLKANFEIILDKLKQLELNILHSDGNVPRRGPRPKFSDLEVLSLCLVAEYLSIDSENALYSKLNADYRQAFPRLIDRSNFNRRRRNLFPVLEIVRQQLAAHLTKGEDFFLVDSEPVPISQFSRASRCRTCQELEYALPSYGYCASQKLHYFGYKLHATLSLAGVVRELDLSPAHQPDIAYLQDLQITMANCKIIGDKGYLSQPRKQALKLQNNISLLTPMRKNQHNYQPFPAIFRKARKRIETVFSQLDLQFNIKRNWAKSFSGLRARILAKVTALTIVQFFNKFLFSREVDQVKLPIY
jgi:hypothetical protein